jgi:ectoine hydroxylase-related dioxygenase (phytanoyl-CoA dioxygenase family)
LTLTITDQQRQQFQEEGYFILERAMSDAQLSLLRGELDRFIATTEAAMTASGTDVIGLNHRGKRYFIGNRHAETEGRLDAFLFGDEVADICKATIGDDAYLFAEQFVVKMAEVGLKFAWHQDSGYLKHSMPGYTRTYVTLWCALDDMSEENGTISVLPFSRAGTREVIDHVKDAALNDLVGYFGDDPGDLVIVPAGSIAVFSSALLHRSGPNHTARPRRSYVVQYSPEPILRPDGSVFELADPLLVGGRRVPRKVTVGEASSS